MPFYDPLCFFLHKLCANEHQNERSNGCNERTEEDILIGDERVGSVTVKHLVRIAEDPRADLRTDNARNKHLREDPHTLEHTRLANGRKVADLCAKYCHRCKITAHHKERANKNERLTRENIEQNICPEKKEVYISSIGQNVGHMNDIISNIIELSKLENNKKKLEKTPCCGASVINKVLAEYEELIKEKELTVEVLGDGIFMWNEMAITRAFDNLINNAVTHSPKNGIIIINISHKSIEICNSYNNQITVKPEQLFDPFVKGDASRGSSGTGLGLCIANGIFDMHKLDASIELGEMFKVKIEKVNLVKKYRLLIIIATAVILLGAIAGGIYSCWYNSNHITYVATGSGTESDSEE